MLCTQLAGRMSGSGEGGEGGVSVRSGILRNSQVTGGREREGETIEQERFNRVQKGNEHDVDVKGQRACLCVSARAQHNVFFTDCVLCRM